ncbi:MAG: histidine--tRNA ligase [Fimbriimonadaceae bacterium]|nr:histidine--tRNA ligase [Fimbriimonadaceae bacterium]
MRFQKPRGTHDVLPGESYAWRWLESTFFELAGRFGYREIRTPMFEDAELFVRTSGETSDVVSKEMYRFTDKGGRDVALKPEGTAPALRAYLEHSLGAQGGVTRLCYNTPFFRYDRPQKGRFRQAHQVGLELVGSSSPLADAEVIEVTTRFFAALGLDDTLVKLNSLGRDACRDAYRAAILEYAEPFLRDAPEDYRDKVRKNPLRLLDSKDPTTQEALVGCPSVLQFLEDESRARFDRLQGLLQEAGIAFRVSPEIVRGLDYYTETVFEVHSERLGAQTALCGGGRYDDLVEELGGSPTPSVGVGIGIERALMVVEELGSLPVEEGPLAFAVAAGPETATFVRALARTLRDEGIACMVDVGEKSLKSQMKQVDRANARYALIVGESEVAGDRVTVRDLVSGTQSDVSRDELPFWLKARRP